MKYFVVSDIHSFAMQLKAALRAAGFNKRNKDHTLIVCGDVFDRGPDSLGVYNYIMSVPKKRRILIKGNHEDLFLELLKKDTPESYDFSNYTVDTFCQIARPFIVNWDCAAYYFEAFQYSDFWYRQDEEEYGILRRRWQQVVDIVKDHPITKWLQSNEWKNYYEVDKYIFVHSFIPVNNNDGLPGYYIHNRNFTEMPDWRTAANESDWYDARWGCPWKNYARGLFETEEKNGKILVCGHWVVTDFRENLDCDFSQDTGVYYSNHLIGLDCGCWHYRGTSSYYHPTNVLVIDGDKCYDQHGKELVYYKAEPFTVIETVPASEVKFKDDEL